MTAGRIRVKICGLRTPATVAAAVAGGAAYVGFVFFPKSPRHLTLAEAAALAVDVPPGVAKVALTVDADDAMLDAIAAGMPVDVIQLHGSESPERVREVRARLGLPYWSLSKYLKFKVKRAVNFIGDFEAAVAREARRRGSSPRGRALRCRWRRG
jgi:phosphoribosylanthranilate isomerase